MVPSPSDARDFRSMIDLKAAEQLIDFGARIGKGHQADEQLKGAVALHNILCEKNVAYLADEVGMGKTYVALGTLALFRHYNPSFRALIIAPRENIQAKWVKEFRNFVEHNVRFPDMRVKAIDGSPARPLVSCGNLPSLVHEAGVDPNRDFFVRLTSFSLPVAGPSPIDPDPARRLRNGLRKSLPWLRDEVFDLRNKLAFKDNFARAVCCGLPVFDLVIVDEGHNLKHGFSAHASARNRVMGIAFGRSSSGTDLRLFPTYGARAKRVLFLSATPIEETYRHLWNQLDIFGHAEGFKDLLRDDLGEEQQKAAIGQFLIRRVTSVRVNGEEYTKNLYRREWRHGGVETFDEPLGVADDQQRLIVALVQKKVSELLGTERFGSSFQIGMLASFESFLETTRTKRLDAEEGNFDDVDQTDDPSEREGIDVADVNRIARSYRQRFGREMPHPKMDAVADSLSSAWSQGEKTLVFVRRVASVKELKRKLDEKYDAWLLERLRNDLPESVRARFEDAVTLYQREKREAGAAATATVDISDEAVDRGGTDTFFAWYFRGTGPAGFVSGANVQQRFIQRGANYSTFFADNHVAAILGCLPGDVERQLSDVLEVDRKHLRIGLQSRTNKFLTPVQRPARADRFEAVQAAAIEWLKDHEGPHQVQALSYWHQLYESSVRPRHTSSAPDIGDWLELKTFFTELSLRPQLRYLLWPESASLRERELRAQLLASAARLGHAFIDLYVMTIQRLGSLDLRAQESGDDDTGSVEVERINEYLQVLDRQMTTPRTERPWGAFDELADIAEQFSLILDTNGPEAGSRPLSEAATLFGQLLRRQQPVGGMSGQVNQTLVRQFRMPGYPLVLVTTELLQEGEDLHLFCSRVHHYGISWTPSSMEQRVGRIDRVRSQTERSLSALDRPLEGKDMLQVHLPYLGDTVEVLQVQRVLERMNVFLRLMHEGLTTAGREDKTIDTKKEFVRGQHFVEQIRERLKSAFPVRPADLRGRREGLEVTHSFAEIAEARLEALAKGTLPGIVVNWERQAVHGAIRGSVLVGDRQQPISLVIQSLGRRLIIRCISPVGRVASGSEQDFIAERAAPLHARVDAIAVEDDRTYDLGVVDIVVLADETAHDLARVAMLARRVADFADELKLSHTSEREAPIHAFSAFWKQRRAPTDDWSRFCRAKDLSVNGRNVDVEFADQRRHHVSVEDEGEHFRLSAVVVRKAVVDSSPDLTLRVWARNRATTLVGFRIDKRGRLLGEAWVPKPGLTAEEFQLYVRSVASECDRFEYLLTGRDVE
jgi:Helicase conserved C-terminal domain/Type III restriction enzyme, res subunit